MRGNGSDSTPNIYLILDYQSGTDTVKFTSLFGGGTELVSPNISCTLNTWHHICATRDYGSMRIYLDGAMIAQTSQNVAGQSDYSNDKTFRIGSYAAAGATAEYYFNGKMAGARMYNRTLTYQEIQQNYQALKYRYGLM
jgi:hypothetical protein